jgi:hypothetical protein
MASPSSAQQIAGDDLFFHSLIKGYISSPRFIERPWLEDCVKEALADSERPFVLITAEPGAGKSAFLAWLASRNESWPRYFIRRDQASPLGPPGARSFLFQTGLQLAALRPEVFRPERIQVIVEQLIGNLVKDAQVIAAEVQKLIASPFMTATMSIRQKVDNAGGNVVGLRVEEWIAEPRLIQVSDLQALALVEPATAIAEDTPGEMVVVLVDALDELRFQPESDSLLDWLANCPELPSNVRLVISSRPDEDLLRTFRARQGARIRELSVDYQLPHFKAHIDGDLRQYAARLGAIPQVETGLSAANETREVFESAVVKKADGNLGYMDALGRAIDRALHLKDDAALEETLALSALPAGLRQLYCYFLQRVKDRVGEQSVSVEDPETLKLRYVSAWSEVYIPILGTLSVAAESLSVAQIHSLADIKASQSEVFTALDRLRQFLDQVNGGFRFYHSTLPDFLCDPGTRNDPNSSYLYQDPVRYHLRISRFYHSVVGGWGDPKWDAIDTYGWLHLSAHMLAATRHSGYGPLFELYSAGFLAAKRQRTDSVAELHDDWRIILNAARESSDFTRFIRFGYHISSQYSEIAHLQTTSVVHLAARLAIRRGDEAAVRRIVSVVPLISHPLARADAALALADELLTGMPESPLIPGLINSVEALLPTLEPGMVHEMREATYLKILARREQANWQRRAREALAKMKYLPVRMRTLSLLVTAEAKTGRKKEAAQILFTAIDECKAFGVPDDLVADLLHNVLGAERIDPEDVLAAALIAIGQGAASLAEGDCAAAIAAIREQVYRIKDWHTIARIEESIFESLIAAGHINIAEANLVPVLDDWIKRSDGLQLIILLPAAVMMGDRERIDAVLSRIARMLDPERGIDWFLSAMTLLASATENVAGVREAIVPLLEGLNECGAGDLEALFGLCGAISRCWACAGRFSQARAFLEDVLASVPSTAFQIHEFPEVGRARAAAFCRLWLSACMIGDLELMDRTLDWLFSAVPRAVFYNDVGKVWGNAVEALEWTPDAEIAQHALDRLRIPLIESRNLPMYQATALLQLADGWAELGCRDECLRLVNRAVKVPGLSWPFHLTSWAAKLRAGQGDFAGGSELIEEVLPSIPFLRGLNIQEEAVRGSVDAVRALGLAGDRGAAAPLFTRLLELAQGIDRGEYSLYAISAVVKAARECGMEIGSAALAKRANAYLKDRKASRGFRPVLLAIGALRAVANFEGKKKAAGAEKDARKLFEGVQRALEHTVIKTDSDRSTLCEEYASLVNLNRQTGLDGPALMWLGRCSREASATSDAHWRLDACAAVAHMSAWLNGPKEGAKWLEQAITASAGLAEVFQVKQAADRIFGVWEEIPGAEARVHLVPQLQSIIWRLPDPYARDVLMARLAVGVWQDQRKFSELLSHVVTSSGITVVLDAVRAHDRLPEGLAPGILYEVVASCTRQPRPVFAGEALAATQAAAHHKLFPSEVLAASLREIEGIMSEISGSEV